MKESNHYKLFNSLNAFHVLQLQINLWYSAFWSVYQLQCSFTGRLYVDRFVLGIWFNRSTEGAIIFIYIYIFKYTINNI